MAAVAGQGTTFNLPNFVGELFSLTPADTPFLSMIGGLSGGMAVNTPKFAWQTTDNNAAAQTVALEGADPTYEERDRAETTNVLQIMQYGIEVSYTKQAATDFLGSGFADAGPSTAALSILGNQPVQDELALQTQLKIERAARDVEFSFLNGTYQATNVNTATNERQTRGMFAAVTTNETAAGAAALTEDMVGDTLQAMYDQGAPFRNVVIFCNSFQKRQFSSIYGFAPESRTVGGVNIQTIETDFGRLGIVLDRHVPADDILFADVSVCTPVFMQIPGKGHFFTEPLAQTGAAWKWQLYGEIGLKYGPEQWHGKITNLSTS